MSLLKEWASRLQGFGLHSALPHLYVIIQGGCIDSKEVVLRTPQCYVSSDSRVQTNSINDQTNSINDVGGDVELFKEGGDSSESVRNMWKRFLVITPSGQS